MMRAFYGAGFRNQGAWMKHSWYCCLLLSVLLTVSTVTHAVTWVARGERGDDPGAVSRAACEKYAKSFNNGAIVHPDVPISLRQEENQSYRSICWVGEWTEKDGEPHFWGQGQTWITAIPLVCEQGAILEENAEGNLVCRKYCEPDTVGEQCAPEPEDNNACTRSAHPISFFKGQKLRTEPLMVVGGQNPIEFSLHFNNRANHNYGIGSLLISSLRLAGESAPVLPDELKFYTSEYSDPKYSIEEDKVVGKELRYTGNRQNHWRHSYSHFLNTAYFKNWRIDKAYIYMPKGDVKYFDSGEGNVYVDWSFDGRFNYRDE